MQSGNVKAIVWSEQSAADIDRIFNHYHHYSPETALTRITNIISETDERIGMAKWKVDEFDSRYRRIFVDEKRFRVLHIELENVILITRVYPTKSSTLK